MEVHCHRWEGGTYGVAGLERSKDVRHGGTWRGATKDGKGKCRSSSRIRKYPNFRQRTTGFMDII